MTNYEVAVDVLDRLTYVMPQMKDFLSDRNRSNGLKVENNFAPSIFEELDDIMIYCGMTKMAIVVEDFDYVIKIPFVIETHLGTDADYCEIEYENYKLAKEYGLARHFAACERLPAYHFYSVDYDGDSVVIDIPLYIMEFAEVDEECTESLCSDCYICDSDDFSDDQKDAARIFSNYYTDDEVEDLVAFMADNAITDIHCGNIGYINGVPVLIDYSGYMG